MGENTIKGKLSNALGMLEEDPIKLKGKEMATAIFKHKPEDRIKLLSTIKETLKYLIETDKNKLLDI